MVKINLRKYYPDYYTTDCIIEVPDEVAALMYSYEHAEAVYYLRRYRHKAYYSLDCGTASSATFCSCHCPPARSTSEK